MTGSKRKVLLYVTRGTNKLTVLCYYKLGLGSNKLAPKSKQVGRNVVPVALLTTSRAKDGRSRNLRSKQRLFSRLLRKLVIRRKNLGLSRDRALGQLVASTV